MGFVNYANLLNMKWYSPCGGMGFCGHFPYLPLEAFNKDQPLYYLLYYYYLKSVCCFIYRCLMASENLFFRWHFCHVPFQSPLNINRQESRNCFLFWTAEGRNHGMTAILCNGLCHHLPLCVSDTYFLSINSRADGRMIFVSVNFLKPCWLSRSHWSNSFM